MTELGIGVVGLVFGLLVGWVSGRRRSPGQPSNPYAVTLNGADGAVESADTDEAGEASLENGKTLQIDAGEVATATKGVDTSGEAEAMMEASGREAVADEGRDDSELVTLRAAVTDLEALTGELRSDLARYKRWAEGRFWQLAERLDTTWTRAKLPLRVHELPSEVAKKYHGPLDEMTAELADWLATLELGSGEVCHRIGLWKAMGGDRVAASQWFRKAVQKGLGFEAWLALGDCLWDQGRRDKAREAYVECARGPGMPDHVFLRSAQAAIDHHRYREALASLETLLDRPKPPVEVFTLASLACGKLHDDQRAVELCEHGLSVFSDNPHLLASQIIPLARLGELERAVAIHDRVRELAPEVAEAPFALGVVRLNAGDTDAALQLFDEALVLDPERAEVYFCLGVIHNQRGEFREALEDLQRAVQLKPEYAEAYYNMKDSFEGLRDFDSAMEMLQKATRLNPEYR